MNPSIIRAFTKKSETLLGRVRHIFKWPRIFLQQSSSRIVDVSVEKHCMENGAECQGKFKGEVGPILVIPRSVMSTSPPALTWFK
jgi:hypothetical protein